MTSVLDFIYNLFIYFIHTLSYTLLLKNFLFIQWNCRGLRLNFNNFCLLYDNYNPIVCCLQETILTMDNFVIRCFNCILLTSRDIGGGACGGVSLLDRDGIPCREWKLNTTLQAKTVTISTSKTITLCSLYLPPNENLYIVLLTRLLPNFPLH